MDKNTYASWFDELLSKAGRHDATRRLFNSLAVPTNGAGILSVLGIVAKGCSICAVKNPALELWSSHINVVYGALCSIVSRHPTLSAVTDRELNLDTFGPLSNLGTIGERKLFPSVLESIGWIVMEALRNNEIISTKSAAQILTLQRSASRKNTDSDWELLCTQTALVRSTLEDLAKENRNKDVSALASKLLNSAFLNLNAPFLEIPSTIANDPEDAQKQKPQNQGHSKSSSEKKSTNTPLPSVVNLKSKASYVAPIASFANQDSYDRLAPKRLKKTTTILAADLELMGIIERPALASIAILSLYINHNPRSTLNLSLIPNNDIWLGKCANIYFNHDVYIGLSGNLGESNIVKIALPSKLKKYLKRQLAKNPNAKTLAELLNITEQKQWLSKLENYLSNTGDRAHKTTPGRLSHSLNLIYLEVGSTYEFAALDTLSPEITGDSALNYVRVDYKYAQTIRSRVAQYLDLGDIEDEDNDPPWIGSKYCPSTDELIEDWNEQSSSFTKSLNDIEIASSKSEVMQAFNIGSAANTRAFRVVTASRMQLTAHPTRRDLLSNQDYIYVYDKNTQPSSARLLKRSRYIDQIINAQQKITQIAYQRLLQLKLTLNEIPKSIASPGQQEAFFTELYFDKKARLKSRAIDIKTVTLHTNTSGELASNSSRQWWGSVCASQPEPSWISRSILGHSRKLAIVGSWCSLAAPAYLIQQAGQLMTSKIEEIDLLKYTQSDNSKIDLISANFSFKGMDKTRINGKSFNPAMPKHYCDHTTLPAVTMAEEIRKLICDNKKCSSSAKTLLSLVFMDGITNDDDIHSIWLEFKCQKPSEPLIDLKWRRDSGQEIQIPAQPSTRSHLGLANPLSEIDFAAKECITYLKDIFPSVTWPETARGLMRALIWIMCRWQRVHVPPFLLYCFDSSVVAATYSSKSQARLLHGENHSQVNSDDIANAAKPCKLSSKARPSLSTLQNSFGKIANGNLKKGGDKKRSTLLLKLLEEEFTFNDSDPSLEIIVNWLSIELMQWIQGETNPIEVDVMYQYLSRVLRRISCYPHTYQSPTYWSANDWRNLCNWILNVDDKLIEKQTNIRLNRDIALRRILTTLANNGIYKIPSEALPGLIIDKSRTWCESASRVYVSNASTQNVASALAYIYKDWEIKSLQSKVLHELFISGCMRSRENSALMSKHIGDGIAVMTECGFSHIKTTLSERLAILSTTLSTEIEKLIKLLSKLPYPPEHLFSEEDTVVNLTIGRDKADVIVQLYRLILGDPAFVLHSLRGYGLQQQITPDFERSIHSIFSEGYFPLENSLQLVSVFNASDPSYLANCFLKSGHASHRTPAESYCSIWPYWYAAFMRSTQVGQCLTRSLANSLSCKSDEILRTERRRFGSVDEWNWAILPNRRDRKNRVILNSMVNSVNLSEFSAKDVPTQDDSSEYRYLVYRHFELDKVSSEHEANCGRSSSDLIDSNLLFAPSFKHLHKRTPGRIDKEGRPKLSALRRAKGEDNEDLIEFIRVSSARSALVLDDLLSNKCLRISPNDIISALSAIPLDFSLQICWAKGSIDTQVASLLASNKRITGLDERKHISRGIRARVVPPGEKPSEFEITHTTTLIRTVLSIRKSFSTSKSKGF